MMRKAAWELVLILLAITGIHTLRIMNSGVIHGKLYPASPVKSVTAVNGTDSVKTVSENGSFVMTVNPGIWKVVVAMKEQTKNVIRENIEVTGGKRTNLGEIRLTE
jgi:hypothetical protein